LLGKASPSAQEATQQGGDKPASQAAGQPDSDLEDWELASRQRKHKAPSGMQGGAHTRRSDSPADLVVDGNDTAAGQARDGKGKKTREAKDSDLRAPICAILGHVDTGKTSLLDKIRSTNVQGKEVGGITQQIGSTFFSTEFLQAKTREFPMKLKYKIPGLLIIDTPGHESFSNLRSRGSSLADVAILVVDIMHGIENQTLESLALLQERHCPFIIALNKIDRLYEWKSVVGRSSKVALEQGAQTKACRQDFEKRFEQVKVQFMEQGINIDLWWKVEDLKDYAPVVPTSAITEEGIPDLLAMLVGYTQRLMHARLESDVDTDEMQCTILEVRKEEGFGYTLDCILVNGYLCRGDTIVMAGLHGPITTRIKELLTPREATEIREKGTADYVRNPRLDAAIGLKIAANDLEFAIAGTPILKVEEGDNVEALEEAVMNEVTGATEELAKGELGVYVHSSSLGALEALVSYLRAGVSLTGGEDQTHPGASSSPKKQQPVPISGCAIGPVTKNTVQEVSLQLDHGKKEYAVVLAFDVEVTKQAEAYAKELGVKIFRADIIYHLYDMYVKHAREVFEERREQAKPETVFPCVMRIIASFHNKEPLIIGVKIERGFLRLGQPLCFPNGKALGTVEGIEKDKKPVEPATHGMEVAIRIAPSDSNTMYGRTFDKENDPILYTHMTRRGIDILKEFYREELTKEDWICVKFLKDELGVE